MTALPTAGSSSVAEPRQESRSPSRSTDRNEPTLSNEIPKSDILPKATLQASENEMLVSLSGKKRENYLGKKPNMFAVKSVVEPGSLSSLIELSVLG